MNNNIWYTGRSSALDYPEEIEINSNEDLEKEKERLLTLTGVKAVVIDSKNKAIIGIDADYYAMPNYKIVVK